MNHKTKNVKQRTPPHQGMNYSGEFLDHKKKRRDQAENNQHLTSPLVVLPITPARRDGRRTNHQKPANQTISQPSNQNSMVMLSPHTPVRKTLARKVTSKKAIQNYNTNDGESDSGSSGDSGITDTSYGSQPTPNCASKKDYTYKPRDELNDKDSDSAFILDECVIENDNHADAYIKKAQSNGLTNSKHSIKSGTFADHIQTKFSRKIKKALEKMNVDVSLRLVRSLSIDSTFQQNLTNANNIASIFKDLTGDRKKDLKMYIKNHMIIDQILGKEAEKLIIILSDMTNLRNEKFSSEMAFNIFKAEWVPMLLRSLGFKFGMDTVLIVNEIWYLFTKPDLHSEEAAIIGEHKIHDITKYPKDLVKTVVIALQYAMNQQREGELIETKYAVGYLLDQDNMYILLVQLDESGVARAEIYQFNMRQVEDVKKAFSWIYGFLINRRSMLFPSIL